MTAALPADTNRLEAASRAGDQHGPRHDSASAHRHGAPHVTRSRTRSTGSAVSLARRRPASPDGMHRRMVFGGGVAVEPDGLDFMAAAP
jgi:hypothetical protein